MSNMYDYKNIDSLMLAAKDYGNLDSESLRQYALKFVFGILDSVKRENTGKIPDNIQKRTCMLKKLIGTIAKIEI